MLSRVVLGSLLVASTAHTEPADGIAVAPDPVEDGTTHRAEGVLGTGGAGARYSLIGTTVYLELQAFGERDALGSKGAIAKLGLARVEALGIEHDLVAGVGYVQASTEPEQLAEQTMATHNPLLANKLRGGHRFLSAYINDTVRFIRGLDVTAGLVVEEWRNLGGDSTITYGSGPAMQIETPDVSELLIGPTLSMTGQLGDQLALQARTVPGARDIGPVLTLGRVVAQVKAVGYAKHGSGVATEASVQPLPSLLASIGYVRTTAVERAAVAMTFNSPRVATLTARYDTDANLDALAVRRIGAGISGFLGVEDALRERMFQVGVRGYFVSGTP